jgi:hypothetical protein
MFVKGEECADDGTAIGEGDAEAVFDVAEEFGSFAGWHFVEFYLWYELKKNDTILLFAIECSSR